MNLARAFKLITTVQNKRTTYQELAEFLFSEAPPQDHNFLRRINDSVISENIKSRSYDEILELSESPRAGATIAFLINYPFQYYIYKNIYRYLPEAEFVIDAAWIRRNVDNWQELLESFASFLQAEKAYFRIFTPASKPEEFFAGYEVLISYSRTPPIDFPCNVHKKKIRVMYGHSKDLWNFGAWSRVFDLALTYGPYSHERMSPYVKSVVVGNPRFDDWFNRSTKSSSASYIEKRIDSSKKTVFYVPTHGSLSSLEKMPGALFDLNKLYNVIIRPHPLTLYTERERFMRFKEAVEKQDRTGKIVWLDDTVDLIDILFVSDIVISDNSGAIFDAVLVDKPLVLLDFLKEDFFESELKNIKQWKPDLSTRPLTYSQSIEQRIKKEDELKPGEIVSRKEEICSAVAKALANEHYYRPRRRRVRKMLFSFCDGSSGKRAADAVHALLESSPQEKTLIAIQTDIEIRWYAAHIHKIFNILYKAIRDYLNISPTLIREAGLFSPGEEDLRDILFSVVIPTRNQCQSLDRTLASLISQDGIAKNRFEILIVDNNSDDQTKRTTECFIKDHPDYRIRYLALRENKGLAFAKNVGINCARGYVVAFTDDNSVLPRQWLADFRNDFENNPEIAGSGGWLEPGAPMDSEESSVYNKHVYLQRTVPLKHPYKSIAADSDISCVSTSNICYKKSVLYKIGGFNHYFGSAAMNDYEFKIRLHELKFPFFYNARPVMRLKSVSLSDFTRYWLLQGWGYFLAHKVHPAQAHLNCSLWYCIFNAVRGILRVVKEKNFAVLKLSMLDKLKLSLLVVLENLCLWFGKYWVPLFLNEDFG
ncbi:MAG: glycosyltransferase [Candidatus Sungbacteria bacterium]|nr:glycosyltransferase [Candidatus Sungbacteria bacterium]